jgi:hypothetical protein
MLVTIACLLSFSLFLFLSFSLFTDCRKESLTPASNPGSIPWQVRYSERDIASCVSRIRKLRYKERIVSTASFILSFLFSFFTPWILINHINYSHQRIYDTVEITPVNAGHSLGRCNWVLEFHDCKVRVVNIGCNFCLRLIFRFSSHKVSYLSTTGSCTGTHAAPADSAEHADCDIVIIGKLALQGQHAMSDNLAKVCEVSGEKPE